MLEPDRMWLQAIFTTADLANVLHQLTPLKVTMGGEDTPGRALFLGRPRAVELLPGRGLRFSCRARVAWRVVGVKLPVKIHKVTVTLEPRIERRGARDVLAFRVRVEDLDVAAVPAFLDAPIRDRLNKALRDVDHDFAWDFLDTLSFHFGLPAAMLTAETFDLSASWGEVKVTDEAVVLAVSFRSLIAKPGASQAA